MALGAGGDSFSTVVAKYLFSQPASQPEFAVNFSSIYKF